MESSINTPVIERTKSAQISKICARFPLERLNCYCIGGGGWYVELNNITALDMVENHA